jgi:two-component system OmpR family sensor kinase
MSGRTVSPERALIRRTARRITLQTAALFGTGLVVLVALAALFIVRTQNADAGRQLRAAVADDDAVTDPPSGIVIYQAGPAGVRSSPQLNDTALDAAAFRRVAARGPDTQGEVTVGGREYLVRTSWRGDTTVQAGLDLTAQNRERRRLTEALVMAMVAGLAAALAIGSYVARRAVRPLELASERQRRFVADSSHELRTPLAQAHTRAQLLHRSLVALGSQPELAEEASRLVHSTRQLGEIVHELLMSAQLRVEGATVAPVDLAALADEVVDAEQIRASDSEVTITAVHDRGPHTVAGSPTALRRVFNALVDNAFGHVGTGGRIMVSIERRDGIDPAVVCRVSDDGDGFEPRDAEAIFARFSHGNHGNERRFGLGLALAREVVEGHRGTINATAVPGQGATFTVVLPATAKVADQDPSS